MSAFVERFLREASVKAEARFDNVIWVGRI
jgi:hypothetical protein